MIKGSQIAAACAASRKLELIKLELVAIEKALYQAQLHNLANSVVTLQHQVGDVASKLDNEARETYVAARRGEKIE